VAQARRSERCEADDSGAIVDRCRGDRAFGETPRAGSASPCGPCSGRAIREGPSYRKLGRLIGSRTTTYRRS
jgi:hypothetical protein